MTWMSSGGVFVLSLISVTEGNLSGEVYFSSGFEGTVQPGREAWWEE